MRQVLNVLHNTKKKINYQFFYFFLELVEINKDIFNLTSLIHTRIKIEESHKRKDILQCLRCQEYGHSRKYCVYPSRCVHSGEFHPTTNFEKTRDITRPLVSGKLQRLVSLQTNPTILDLHENHKQPTFASTIGSLN